VFAVSCSRGVKILMLISEMSEIEVRICAIGRFRCEHIL
jgi:hypothetical protein